MSRPNIKSLNPLDFTKVLPKRNEIIDNSKATKLPELNSYKANKIAESLHPSSMKLEVTAIKDEVDNCKTYTFKRTDGEPAYFSAGQYLSIAVEIDGKYYSRPYSISSSPKQSLEGYYTLTIKNTEAGLVSSYINNNFVVGSSVIASAPHGQFTYEPLRDAKHIIGIAGGSGVTPFHSLAMSIVDGDEDCDLTLIYGTKTLKDVIFYEDFKKLEGPKFKMINVLSDEQIDGYEHGFITADIIKKYAPQDEYSLFICGPQVMYNFLDQEIAKLGLRRKFIRHELFGEIHDPSKEIDYIKPEVGEYNLTVKMADKQYRVRANINDTLLVTMEKNGIYPPADCRSGVCGLCHSQLISGKVYTPKRVESRRQADLIFGYVHPCVSFPLSDCVIDVPPVKQ